MFYYNYRNKWIKKLTKGLSGKGKCNFGGKCKLINVGVNVKIQLNIKHAKI